MKLARWVCLLDSPSLVRANESNVQTRADWNTGASMWILMQSVGEVATLFPVHGGFVEVSLNIWLLFQPDILISVLAYSTVTALWIRHSVSLYHGCTTLCGVSF